MKIIVDENISYQACLLVKNRYKDVLSIADKQYKGFTDSAIYKMLIGEASILITRDYHFTNQVKYPIPKVSGIIYLRHGNLTSEEECLIIQKYIDKYGLEFCKGKLLTLYKNSIMIR